MSSLDTTFVSKVTTVLATWLNSINDAIWKGSNPIYVTSTGSANAQIITLPSTSLATTLTAGDTFTFKAGYTNTATATLTVMGASSLGAKTLKVGSTSLAGGELTTGTITTVVYDGTYFQLISNISNFLQRGTGAVARPYLSKNRDIWSVFDFMTATEIADVLGRTASVDVTTAVQTAMTAASAASGTLEFPPGIYLIKSSMSLSSVSNFALKGAGQGATIIKADSGSTFTQPLLTLTSCTYYTIEDITFDQNNTASFLSNHKCVVINYTSDDWHIHRCEVKNFTYIAIAADSCKRFYIEDNTISRTSAQSSLNHGINVSSSASVSDHGFIRGNMVTKSGSGYEGIRLTIAENVFTGSGYGAGIAVTTDGTNSYGQYQIHGNICKNGTGTDDDGFPVCGMEIIGAYSNVSNNLCYSNAGSGIRSFLYQGIISDNVCYGNGTLGTANHKSGIQGWYSTSTIGHRYTLVSNNHCFDGGGGTQAYGYAETDSNCRYNRYYMNDFSVNATANAVFANGGLYSYFSGDTTEYTWGTPWNPGTIANGARSPLVFTGLNDIAMGDIAIASHNQDLGGCTISAYVNATNQVTVVITNNTGSGVTVASGTTRIKTFKIMV